MKRQSLRSGGIALGSLVLITSAVGALVLLTYDWNQAKPWLNARTSEALGRPFSIDGDLSLNWNRRPAGLAEAVGSWRAYIPWPHFVAHDIRIGNPPDIRKPNPADAKDGIATIGQLAFSLSPVALLQKKIVIPVLSFESPDISLVRDAGGRNNWTFKNNEVPSPWQLELQRVAFSKGRVHLVDAINGADVTADIESISGNPEASASANVNASYGVAWKLRGKFNGESVSGSGKAGSVLSLTGQTAPYPIMADLRIGKTVIAVEGSMTRPAALAAVDMQLKLSGPSMAGLYAISGLVLPETPPFATEGHLTGTIGQSGNHWIYDKFTGKVGGSDISGTLDYQAKQPRGLLSGSIVSRLLQFSDLAPVVGVGSQGTKGGNRKAELRANGKILPAELFRTERWTSIDADIKFSADKILHAENLPIEKLTTNLRLQNGVLSLKPLSLDVAGGSLRSNITLDANGKAGKNAIKAEIDMSARHLKLSLLFPGFDLLKESAGEINGNASLSAMGNSVASLLGASNGEIKAVVSEGTVSKLLLEELGLNIGSVVLTHLVGDKQVKLNCMAADFKVTDGSMQARSFIVDTEDALLTIVGDINLAQERLNLTIDPDSKGLRVFSLRAPLYVRGSFDKPSVTVDKGVLALKAGSAIALAVIAPVAGLLPLINTGPEGNSQCAELIAKARVKAQASPPGKMSRGVMAGSPLPA